MKKTLWLLFLSLCLCGCAKEEPENPYRLKTNTIARYGSPESYQDTLTYSYDEQNQLIRVDNSIGSYSLYTYDAYGNQIHTEEHRADGTVDISEMILTLDEEHRPIHKELYYNGNLFAVFEYSYNKNGLVNQLDITRFLEDMTIQNWVTRKYDREGNLLREETKWSNGHSGYDEYQYQDGHLHYYAEYNGENELQRYNEITWDAETRTETRNHFRYDGVSDGYTVTTFDEYGNMLREEHFNGPYSHFGAGDDIADRVSTCTYELIPE